MSEKRLLPFLILVLFIPLIITSCRESGGNSSLHVSLPLKVQITPGRHKLTVKWKPVPKAETCIIKINSKNDYKSSSITKTENSGNNFSVIPKLKDGTDYYIWVIATGRNGFTIQRGPLKIRTKRKIQINNTSIYLSKVPGDIMFPRGINDEDIYGKNQERLPGFEIADTETTNEVVAEVFQWALEHNRIGNKKKKTDPCNKLNIVNKTTVVLDGCELLNLDGMSNNTSCGIIFRSGHFRAVKGREEYPCIYITWYGAVAFCNWLTEMVNGNNNENAYTWSSPLKESLWKADKTLVLENKKGFRLPGTMEWELAARYIFDFNGDRDILDKGEYYPGTHASGDSTSYCFPNDTATSKIFGKFGWYKGNSCIKSLNPLSGLHVVGTSGISGSLSHGSHTALSGKFCNALGLFDMSGNVWEMCFTKHGPYRVFRGGSWDNIAYYLHVGGWFFDYPETSSSNHGFRIIKSD